MSLLSLLWCVSHQALAGDKVDNRRYNKTRVRHPHRTLRAVYRTTCPSVPTPTNGSVHWRQRRSGQLRKKEPLIVRVWVGIQVPSLFLLSVAARCILPLPSPQNSPCPPSTVCDRVLPMRRSKPPARMDPQHTPPKVLDYPLARAHYWSVARASSKHTCFCCFTYPWMVAWAVEGWWCETPSVRWVCCSRTAASGGRDGRGRKEGGFVCGIV